MSLAERLDALTPLESTLLLTVAGALAGIVAVLVARAAERYSERAVQAAEPSRSPQHVLDVVVERRSPGGDPKVRLRFRCLAPEGADCRVACEEGTCESWRIERDEKGPFHLAYEEDDDEDEVEVRHQLWDRGAEYCGSVANVDEEPELTYAGDTAVLATVPVVITWAAEDEVYWKVAGS